MQQPNQIVTKNDLLLVATRRKRQGMEIALGGLTSAAVAAYLARRFPNHRLPSELSTRLQEQTSGNPLFMLNAVDEFVQRGWLEEHSGAWECTVDLATLESAVPDGTRAMITFRLQQISPADLDLLEAASVIGVTFATQALAAVVEREPADIEAACTRLAHAAQFLGEGQVAMWPDSSAGMEYVFRHALYHQVLYGRVTPARRQLLHRRVAVRLEKGFATEVGAIAPQLALHFERSGDIGGAVKYRERAARRAIARYAYPQAIEHLHAALALLEFTPAGAERDARELAVRAALLEPYYVVAGMAAPELLQTSERIGVLASHAPTGPESLQGLAVLVPFYATRGAMGPARAAAEQLSARAADFGLGSPAATMAAGALGFCQLMQGEIAAAVEKETLTLTSETGELCWNAELHRLRGEAQRAGLSRQRRGTKPWREMVAAAESHFEKATEIAGRQGARLWQLRTAVSRATLLRDCDRVAEARDHLSQMCGELEDELELPDLRAARALMQSLSGSD